MGRNAQGELTSIWTPANVITCIRICFIPVFMLLATQSRGVAGALTQPALATMRKALTRNSRNKMMNTNHTLT